MIDDEDADGRLTAGPISIEPGDEADVRDALIVGAVLRSGASYGAVAESFGVSYERVRQVTREAGVVGRRCHGRNCGRFLLERGPCPACAACRRTADAIRRRRRQMKRAVRCGGCGERPPKYRGYCYRCHARIKAHGAWDLGVCRGCGEKWRRGLERSQRCHGCREDAQRRRDEALEQARASVARDRS